MRTMCHTNTNRKKAKVALLTSDIADFRTGTLSGVKSGVAQ